MTINKEKERIEIPIYFNGEHIDFNSIEQEFRSALIYLYESEKEIIKEFNGY